jgi:hypothetical protein
MHWAETIIDPRFRTIDELAIRFAESEDRDDQALPLSPWAESLFAFEPTWEQLSEHAHLVAIERCERGARGRSRCTGR